MIVFSLTCPHGHVFEAWFPSGASYDQQVQSGAVACPICGETEIRKAPMAPHIARHRGRPPMPEGGAEPAAAAPAPAAPDSDQAGGPGGSDSGGSDSGESVPATAPDPAAQAWRRLAALCRAVESQTDDVGRRFPEEARRIHYGETPARAIRGQASDSEAEELADEGIGVVRLPWIPSGRH